MTANKPCESHLLLDDSGQVEACTDAFTRCFQTVAHSDFRAIESVFPVGFRPGELIARTDPEAPAFCILACSSGETFPAALSLQRMTGGWLLTVKPPETGYLRDQQAIRNSIASHLHDTTCQDLVGLSMLLGKMERESPAGTSPALKTAMDVCDSCNSDLRALMHVLSPVATNESFSELTRFVEDLRDVAGLDVSAQWSDNAGLGALANTIFLAALQIWAECALAQPVSARRAGGTTIVNFSCGAAGDSMELGNPRLADPAIQAVLSSATILACLRNAGGDMQPKPGQTGSSARLWTERAQTAPARLKPA